MRQFWVYETWKWYLLAIPIIQKRVQSIHIPQLSSVLFRRQYFGFGSASIEDFLEGDLRPDEVLGPL